MPLRPGTRLGPYEIGVPLGAGGMGEVYSARDTRLGREVAIKVLPASVAGDAQALRRLEQEARAIAALNHPNLLSVYDVGTTPEGQFFIVSELLEGQSLRQRLSTGALGQAKAVAYAIQIARGLAAAHDKGIIHRDLKPDNLFVTGDGRVKILDFGLAKMSAQAAAEEQTVAAAATTPGMVLGTVGYMAPEQAKGQPADPRSDIFSFGAVLYEMLAGRRAFPGDSAVEVMSAILKEEPEPLDTAFTGKRPIAPALDRIVRHCLEKEPRQRFQSADDLAFHLGELSQATTTSAVGLPALPRGGGRYSAWAAITVALVVAAAGLAWYAARAGGPPAPPQFHMLTSQRGIITGARFLSGEQGFVLSARWDGGVQDQLFTGRLVANPGLQSLNVSGQEVAGMASDGDVLLLSQGPEYEFGGFGTLAQMPLGGGAPRPLFSNVTAAQATPVGTLILVRRDFKANRETLEYPPGHVLYQTDGWISSPRLSPDGKRIGFLDHPIFSDDGGRAAVVDLMGQERSLSPIFPTTAGLGWSPNGREIWFVAALDSARQLYAANLSGRVRLLLSSAVPLRLEDVARDGRVLLTANAERFSAYAATLRQPQPRDLSVMETSDLRVFSDDGRQALITDFSTGPLYGVYLRGTDGAPPVLLGSGVGVALSPDGQWALSMLPTGRALLLPTGAGEPRSVAAKGVSWQASAAGFLPDSRHAVAVGALPGHAARVYLIGLDGSASPVTPEGAGVFGAWPTPDGKYALAQNANRAWFLYPLVGGAPVPVPSLLPDDQALRFGAANDELYVSRSSTPACGMEKICAQSAVQIYRLDLRTGHRDLLTTISPSDPGLDSIESVAISRDGQTYGYSLFTRLSELYVVDGVH